MITAEIKVNGGFLGILHIRNLNTPDPLNPNAFIYEAEYYEPTGGVTVVNVLHDRSEGALILINKCANEIIKSALKAQVELEKAKSNVKRHNKQGKGPKNGRKTRA